MRKGLTSFGVKCRDHRARRSFVMGDQAKFLGCAVSHISAIERGERDPSPEYVTQFVSWLRLSELDAAQLRKLAEYKRHKFYIANPSNLASSSKSALLEDIRRARRERQTTSKQDPHNISTSHLATLARTYFEIDEKLTFDLTDILENKVHEIEPGFSLQVRSDHILGDQIAAYADSADEKIQKIVLSEHAYEIAHKQTPEGREIATHELAHWFMHQEDGLTFQRYRRSKIQIEKEADDFVSEFLLPERTVRRFNSPSALAATCNVSPKLAKKRMLDLGILLEKASREPPEPINRERVAKGLAELAQHLKDNNTKLQNSQKENEKAKSSDFQLISFPAPPVTSTPAQRAKSSTEQKIADLPLFEHAERSQRTSNSERTQRTAPKPDHKAMLEFLACAHGHYRGDKERIQERPHITPTRIQGSPRSFETRTDRARDWFKRHGWR